MKLTLNIICMTDRNKKLIKNSKPLTIATFSKSNLNYLISLKFKNSMKILSLLVLLVILSASLVLAEDNDKSNLLNLSAINVYSKAERIKYAKGVKEQLFLPIYQTIPALTEIERKWLEDKKKELDEIQNNFKNENIQSTDEDISKKWMEKRRQYTSTTLYLQNQLSQSLRRAVATLNLIIDSTDLTTELRGWSLLINELLSESLREERLSKTIKELENNRGLAFKDSILLLHNISIDIAKDINKYIIINYFKEEIK